MATVTVKDGVFVDETGKEITPKIRMVVNVDGKPINEHPDFAEIFGKRELFDDDGAFDLYYTASKFHPSTRIIEQDDVMEFMFQTRRLTELAGITANQFKKRVEFKLLPEMWIASPHENCSREVEF